MQTAEQAIVERIKLSRGNVEHSQEAPTNNAEAVNVSEDAPIEEVIETEAQADEGITAEIEEEAEEVTEAQAHDEGADLFYYDIDGEEVSSNQLKEWKANGLMQADYTRKTQSHAEDVKTFNAEKESFNAKQSEFNNKLAQLNAMIEEDTPSAEDLAEWREYEPEKYIEHTEKMSNRKKLLASSKAELPQQSVDMAKVSADLAASHPEWVVDGKQSKQFIDDTNLMAEYAEKRGISQSDMASFDARHYEVMLDAARYKSQSTKNAAIEKRIRKAPVSTKPRAAASGIQTDLDAAIKAFRNNPSDKNAVTLRKLKRQLNN